MRRLFAGILLTAFSMVGMAGEAPSAHSIRIVASGHDSGAWFVAVTPALESGERVELFLLEDSAEASPSARFDAAIPFSDDRETLLLARGRPEVSIVATNLLVRVSGRPDRRLLLPEPFARRSTHPVDVAVVVDDSFSMRDTDPGNLRIKALETFRSQAEETAAVRSLSVIAFSRFPRVLLAPSDPAEIKDFDAMAAQLRSSGRTGMDLAFRLAYRTLNATGEKRKVVIFLSDGENAPGSYRDAHALFQPLGWPVHTIGLSEWVDQDTLRRIADETGGRYHFCPNADALHTAFATAARMLDRPVTLANHWIDSRNAGTSRQVMSDASLLSGSWTWNATGDAGSLILSGPAGSRRYELSPGETATFPRPSPGVWSAQSHRRGGKGLLRVAGEGESPLVLYPVRVQNRVLTAAAFLDLDFETPPEAEGELTCRGGGLQLTEKLSFTEVPGGFYMQARVPLPREFQVSLPLEIRLHVRIPEHRLERFAVAHENPLFPDLPEIPGAIPPVVFRGVLSIPDDPPSTRETLPVSTGFAGTPGPTMPRDWPVPLGASLREPSRLALIPEPAEGSGARPSLVPAQTSPGDGTPEHPPPAFGPGRRGVPRWIRIALAALLLLVTLVILIWWLTRRVNMPRMALYLGISLLAHALVFLLTLNLLMETGVVEMEQVAPALAVKIRAMEQQLGVDILPSPPEIAFSEALRETIVEPARAPDSSPSPDRTPPPLLPVPSRPETSLPPAGIKLADERPLAQAKPADNELRGPDLPVDPQPELQAPPTRRVEASKEPSLRTRMQAAEAPRAGERSDSAGGTPPAGIAPLALAEALSARSARPEAPPVRETAAALRRERPPAQAGEFVVAEENSLDEPRPFIPERLDSSGIRRQTSPGTQDSGFDPRTVSRARLGAGEEPGWRPEDLPTMPSIPKTKKALLMTASASSDRRGPERAESGASMNADIGSGTPLASLPVKLALGRYSGDWDCSGAAMLFLGHELEQRSGMAFSASSKPVDLDDPALKDLPFVYLSGHEDFVFSDAELQNLRQYLEGGGHLWIDDSTHFDDTRFDTAVRRELSRLLPGRTFKRLPEDFEAMRTGYDLSGGYMGYSIPPGDKYRLDYFEGIELDGRIAVVYTRNDYGDGLNIDPHTHPLAESLTDLSPAEMQEGALRMGINLVLFFLEQRAGGVGEHIRETRLELRSSAAPADPVPPAGKSVALEAAADSAQWQVEDWADAATLHQEGQGIRIAFSSGSQRKNAITHTLDPVVPFKRSQAFVVDVHSHLNSGARLAVGFFSGDEFYESRPCFLKPGKNTAVFPLDDEHFKSARTGWEYSGRFPETLSIDRLTLLIYAPGAGAVTLHAPRLVHGD